MTATIVPLPVPPRTIHRPHDRVLARCAGCSQPITESQARIHVLGRAPYHQGCFRLQVAA